MSARKKAVRRVFRERVLERDGHRCRKCGAGGPLDAHHITDRTLMPNGGYVAENGISLCAACHRLADAFHSTGVAHPGYAPEDLYAIIGSAHGAALDAAERAGER